MVADDLQKGQEKADLEGQRWGPVSLGLNRPPGGAEPGGGAMTAARWLA